jgi:hypothetical protein
MQSRRWSRRQVEWWKERAEQQARRLKMNNVMAYAHALADSIARGRARDRALQAAKANPRTRPVAYKTTADRAIAMAATVAPYHI